jgi:hypothetical protein
MSFNNNDINPLLITLGSYEEYFIMYVDEELTTEEKTAVEKFIIQHPQLQEELDILLSTKIPAEALPFENKETLLAGTMKLNGEEENILLYLDNELQGTEKAAFEKKLEANPEVRRQYHLFLQTKLDSKDKIIYPYKKELYHNHRSIRPAYWMRIAAAAVIVAGMGTFAFYNKGSQPTSGIANIDPLNKTEKNTLLTDTILKAKQPAEEVAINKDMISEQKVSPLVATKKTIKNSQLKKPASLEAPVEKNKAIAQAGIENAIIKNNSTIVQPSVDAVVNHNNAQPENNFKAGVTSATTAAYNTSQASDNEIIDAVATSENKKGRAIRGFLRKATRFIERTTNIDPVNEDDKLLIGAVALKLK